MNYVDRPTLKSAFELCDRIRLRRAALELEESVRVEKMKERVRSAAIEAIAPYCEDRETAIRIVALLDHNGMLNFTNYD